jgi:hypothetical protein
MRHSEKLHLIKLLSVKLHFCKSSFEKSIFLKSIEEKDIFFHDSLDLIVVSSIIHFENLQESISLSEKLHLRKLLSEKLLL